MDGVADAMEKDKGSMEKMGKFYWNLHLVPTGRY